MQLSVIIPCHNAGLALQDCAASLFRAAIPGETQLLFVDDASDDGSISKIVQIYGAKPEFTLLRHATRCGVAAARNTALRAAQGKYIAFCDADDRVAPDFFTRLIALIETSHAALAACAMSREAGKKSTIWRLPQATSGKELIAQSMPSPALNSCCNKLYRKDEIDAHSLCFDENASAAEDLLFNVYYLIDVQTVTITNEVLYHYVARDDSITTRETAEKARSSVAAARLIGEMTVGDPALCGARQRLLTDALMTTLRADGFTAVDSRALLAGLSADFWRDRRFGIVKQRFLQFASHAPQLARLLMQGMHLSRRAFHQF